MPKTMTTPSFTPATAVALTEVIEFAVECAREAIEYEGADADAAPCMGLWQAFQERFPKGASGLDYDMLISAWSSAYRSTVKAFRPKATERPS